MIKLMTAVLACCLLSSAHARDDASVTYVGGGKWACSGDSYKCARIEQENQREAERQRRDYQRDQERAQDYVERARQREEDYMRRNYGR